MVLSEIFTLLIWAFGILNLLEPLPGAIGIVGQILFWVLLIAHVIEIAYFKETIAESKDGIVKGSILTLIFGIFYIKSIEN